MRGRETLVSVQSEPKGSLQASVQGQGEWDEVQGSVSESPEQSGPVLALVRAQQEAVSHSSVRRSALGQAALPVLRPELAGLTAPEPVTRSVLVPACSPLPIHDWPVVPEQARSGTVPVPVPAQGTVPARGSGQADSRSHPESHAPHWTPQTEPASAGPRTSLPVSDPAQPAASSAPLPRPADSEREGAPGSACPSTPAGSSLHPGATGHPALPAVESRWRVPGGRSLRCPPGPAWH